MIERWRELVLTLTCLAVLVVLGLYLRWPATEVELFRNEDVAGITYNADVLRHGMAPLVDNLEYKEPGSFFLVYGIWSLCGRSMHALETVGVFWTVLAGLGVFVAGRVMFGVAGGMVAGLLYTLCAPFTDSITVNYNTWMLAAYVWSTVFFIFGLRRGRWWWFAACGLAMTCAALLKRQGGLLFPIYFLVLWVAPALGLPEGWGPVKRKPAIAAYAAGMTAGFIPFGLFYLVRSGWRGVWTFYHHFFFSPSGWRYVGGELEPLEKFLRLEDGFTGFYEFTLLPTILACLTITAVPQFRRRGWALLGLLLGGNFVLSAIGISLGFRFYKGYYLHAIPAAAWLAAHPEGPLLRWFRASSWPTGFYQRASRAFLVALVFLIALTGGMSGYYQLKQERAQRGTFAAYQHEALRIAEHVQAHTKPSQRIWVWGRWAWPVYFYADRLSVTPYYKVLGVITNNLTNTWKRPTAMTRFVPLGPHEEIGRQLRQGRPAFIVTANNEDYSGFKALEELLRTAYQPVNLGNITAFHVYQLKAGGAVTPRPARGVAPRKPR